MQTKFCAIYTRKSTEEGLEQEFNSLHAQREACQAYIKSQKSEGWGMVKTHYDDGGFSGGNTNRPALQQLLADIKARKIDIVVAYKIDRLTRSLMDFSKLVEVFDAYGVSFISVTQSFNTTTSVGRLTLNMLLSFAQFEREVTGERIRDKVAASKKKGMWMGGTIPLGYDLKDRQLLINASEAEIIQMIFRKYLELNSVTDLKAYLDSMGVLSKVTGTERVQRGGKPITRSNLYYMLVNPLYIGKIKHKDQIFEGQQAAIIDQETWDKVQLKLRHLAVNPLRPSYIRKDKPLSKKIYDCDGHIYTPVASKRGNKQYRYYISNMLLQAKGHPNHVIARVSATHIENLVRHTISALLQNTEKLGAMIGLSAMDSTIIYIQNEFKASWVDSLITKALTKVVIYPETIKLHISIKELCAYLAAELSLQLEPTTSTTHIEIIPFASRRGDKVVILKPEKQVAGDPFDRSPSELKNWVRGVIWRNEFFSGTKMAEIAQREGITSGYVARLIERSLVL